MCYLGPGPNRRVIFSTLSIWVGPNDMGIHFVFGSPSGSSLMNTEIAVLLASILLINGWQLNIDKA